MFRTQFLPVFDAAGDGGAAAAAAAASAGAKPWYDGVANVPPEYIGHWQNTGLDKKTPAEAAVELTKGYLEARKFIGAPPSEVVLWPKDAGDEQRWQAVRTRLGVPTDKNQYDEGLKALRQANGQPIDEEMVALGRELAAKVKLPAADAPALVQGIMEERDRRAAADLADRTAKIADSKAALKKDWGANFNVNDQIARQTAQKLGIKRETVEKFENSSDYAEIMNMFLSLGQRIGEDKLVLPGSTVLNNGVMTQAQATAEIERLKTDAVFVEKWSKGDAEAVRLWNNLNKLKAGYQAA